MRARPVPPRAPEMTAAKFVVGVTDHMIGQPDLEAALLGDGAEVDFFGATEETGFDPARLRRLDAPMLWGARLGHDSIAHLTRCRGVVRYGVGYEKVDLAALAEAGIPFANNPDYGTDEVADRALAKIVSLQRRLWEHDARARHPRTGWQVHSLSPLSRSNRCTVGVVGVRRIGTAVINRLRPFGFAFSDMTLISRPAMKRPWATGGPSRSEICWPGQTL